MEEGAFTEAASPGSRIILGRCVGDYRTAVAANDIVTRVSGMRRIVDAKLRVVKNVESFGAELQSSFAKNLEILQQGNVEIRPSRIVHRISPATSKSQALGSDEGRRIGEQGPEKIRVVPSNRLSIVGIRYTVRIRTRPKVVRHAAVVRHTDPAGTSTIDHAEWGASLKNGDSG